MSKKQTSPNARGMHGMAGGEKAKNFKQSIKKFFVSLKPFRFSIIFSLMLAVFGTILTILSPNIIKKINEEIFIALKLNIGIDLQKILTIGLWLIGMYILSFIFSYLQGYIMGVVSAKVSKDYRTKLSQKINKMPLKYFDSESNGDVLSRVTNDVDTIGQTLNQSLSSIVTCLTMLVGSIAMMFVNSWQLTLITLLATPISMFLILIVVKISQKYFKNQQKSLGELNGIVEENYNAHNIVKSFNLENATQQKYEITNKKLYTSSLMSQSLSSTMYPIMNFISNIVYVLVCVVGGIISISNPVFAVTVITFIVYMRFFNQQIGQVAQISSTLQSTAAATERVFEFLAEEEMADESNKSISVTGKPSVVEFKNVCFGYEKDKPIIKDFSAVAKLGQKIAIVGPTGAGKTTIVNLLMRFYEIDSGKILIDGVDTKDMTREQCRNHFGMVLQDAWLFNGTIRENISFGTQGLTNEQIENACCFAHIDHFIRSLPNGYDMLLDETANISQGQRQLLTIARAMVNNAPMLILDEATSNVDTRTEIMIQKAMDKLMEGRTSFVIAHRLSTIKNADLILVMKDGNIVEQGNHDELLAQNGYYAELYNSQFSE